LGVLPEASDEVVKSLIKQTVKPDTFNTLACSAEPILQSAAAPSKKGSIDAQSKKRMSTWEKEPKIIVRTRIQQTQINGFSILTKFLFRLPKNGRWEGCVPSVRPKRIGADVGNDLCGYMTTGSGRRSW
jgi:hypothetical protein